MIAESRTAADNKFGTFAGVFTPTILTILGAIMYLREGFVIGNAGLVGGIAIILLAHLITICTGLAVSSIATNTKVGAGGAFAIISQSLGFEMGGAIGIPLYLAQGISVAFYVLAFTEGWVGIFPSHPFALSAIVAFAVVFVVAYISAQFAARIQFVIMAVIALSLVSIALGSFPIGSSEGFTQTPQLIGDFSKGSFWKSFAIFFPAVTGIMAGISMSGSLKSPRKSLPLGTMGAVFVGLVAYIILAVWLAYVATPQELTDTSRIVMADKAFWSWAVYAGLLGATFSSALGSIIAAPRVMQALALKNIIPASGLFSQQTVEGEPRQATIFTGVIGVLALFVAIASGGLDAIADILTMFFLITYMMLNVVVLIEQQLSMVSFRPTFAVPRIIPFIGMIICIFTMLLVNPTFTFVAIVVVLTIYIVLSRRKLDASTGDVRSGLFNALARWSVVRASKMPEAPERSWSPMVLAPLRNTGELAGSYRFLHSITAPQGAVQALGIYQPSQQNSFANLEVLTDSFEGDGIMARATLLEEEDFVNGVRSATQILRKTFFRPNILFFNLRPDSNREELRVLIEHTAAYRMGIVLLSRHPVIDMGREQVINVWVRPNTDTWQWQPKLGNKDLSLLLAYQLRKNWRGQINLCIAARTEEESNHGAAILDELLTLTRLPKSTAPYVINGTFSQAIVNAPEADLTIIGLPDPIDLSFCQHISNLVDGSCIFVRDSGDESAFA